MIMPTYDSSNALDTKDHAAFKSFDLSSDGLRTKDGIVLVPQPSQDPEDPLNWARGRKLRNLTILCMAGFAGTALDLANQLAMKDQAKNWNKELIDITYTISASIAGIAYGPLLINPVAQALGRTAIIFWCLVFAMACAIWSACMTSRGDYDRFVASRLFDGIFGSIPSIVGVGAVYDMFFLHERGKAYAIFHVSFLFGTVFWWIVIAQGVVLILAFLFLEETSYSRDGKTLSAVKPTNFWANRMATLLPHKTGISRAELGRIARLPFRIGLSPVGLLIGIFQLASFGWFVATHSLLTVWLEKPVSVGGWGFSPQRNALCMSSSSSRLHQRPTPKVIFSLWVGLLTAELWGYLCNDRIALWICRTREKGVWKPECRLHALWIPSLIVLPIGLGIVGSALQYHLHNMVLALGAYLITFASMSSVHVAVTYMIECVASQPTEVGAFMGAYRLTLGLVVPFLINHLRERTLAKFAPSEIGAKVIYISDEDGP
ncbi:MFS general substrate transporter [Aspergillus neoniger CBS 115656]|uniref:MFS general substrate transporter n=1 Tax=Aspergillus neoniger (strain CBS 115656) TaxID=1448310 RepID=A0A318YCU9_ASPNB|nr:MFS general substrate transporter [Aspergillus neoniger CBS 115656]PYH32206.1 MFS general substrate transporter [Aspergillus neoniger CBS 115656]